MDRCGQPGQGALWTDLSMATVLQWWVLQQRLMNQNNPNAEQLVLLKTQQAAILDPATSRFLRSM